MRREDISPEAERVLIEMVRNAPLWKRMQKVDRLIRARRILILFDLRCSYPEANTEELRKRLAARLLPREDVIRIFDWDPEKEGY